MIRKITIILFTISLTLSAQLESFERFPMLEPIDGYIPESVLVEGTKNELIMFWVDSTDLSMSRSIDEGVSWSNPVKLYDQTERFDSLSDLNVLKIISGRILVTFKHKFHYLIYSDDNGETWSERLALLTHNNDIFRRRIFESSLSQTDEGKIRFVYNRLNSIFSIQSEDGITWSEMDTVFIPDNGSPHFASIHSHGVDSLILIYHHEVNDTSRLVYQLSQDGKTWSKPTSIIDDGRNKTQPRVTLNLNGDLILTYCQYDPTHFEAFPDQNIFWTELPSGTNSWKDPEKISEYVGFDGWQNIMVADSTNYVSFTSDRVGNGNGIYYGVLGESTDEYTPPKIYNLDIKYQNDYPRVNIYFTAKAYDTDEINNVIFHIIDKGGTEYTVEMFDDGMHGDAEVGDFIFGGELLGLFNSLDHEVYFSATDIEDHAYRTPSENIESPFPPDGENIFLFDNNNLLFPINDRGVIGDVPALDEHYNFGVRFEEGKVIYSAGFVLSGYTNGSLWGNGVMSSTRTIDYLHGTIEDVESKNNVHVVRSSQPDFYQSWIDWIDAVNQGAEFYDGDGDGKYDPIDKNNNGIWDENEDKPNIIGDVTAFTVYNDGLPSHLRHSMPSEPQGIEIKQTAFSYNKRTLPELSNVVYVKYSIENMGTVVDTLDSVYFGLWNEFTIGEFWDDLGGTDTNFNSIYGYNNGIDLEFGNNAPSCFISLVQGPPNYVLSETFTDLNGNGLFDDGIDIALDTAINNKGQILLKELIPGAKNSNMSAAIHYMEHATLGHPVSENQLRYYMLGLNAHGELIDPCNWWDGRIYEEDCATIDSRFMYSGDPVAQTGWINRNGYEQRQLASTGPFNLVKNKPVDIIVAYVIGRGVDSLNSITEARKNVQNAIDFYETNFTYTVEVGVEDNKVDLPEKYVLYQNYPNPFNPTTTISYEIPDQARNDNMLVQLKIYDVLGREVSTPVNKEQTAGIYQVQYDASNLGSGVYFYQIRAGSFVESKKMILLK